MRGHGLPCEYCKREMRGDVAPDHPLRATRDHYIPKSKRREIDEPIIVMACYTCNQIKGDRFPEQWDRFMQRNPRWWEARPFGKKEVTDPSRNRIKAPPLEQTRDFLRQASLRAMRKDEPFPISSADPVAQAAFEGAYKDRKYMLRVEDDCSRSSAG